MSNVTNVILSRGKGESLMVSDLFRNLEDKLGNASVLYEDLIQEIVNKTKKDKAIIERIIHKTCVTTGLNPISAATYINEFLVFLNEEETLPDEEKQ